MMSAANRVSFHGFELDLASLVLLRDGERVPLAPQPLRLLALLAARPGQLVTREEIRLSIWGNRAVEFDQILNYSISQLRAALERGSGAPVIETIPRRGYRFVATIDPLPRAVVPRHGRTLTAVALGLVAAAGIVTVTLRDRPLIRMSPPTAGRMPGGPEIAREFGAGLARHLPAEPAGGASTLTLLTSLEPDTAGVRIEAELRIPGESAPRWRTVMVAGREELGMAQRDLADDASAAARRISGR